MTNNLAVQPVEDFCFCIIKYDALALGNGKDLILDRLKNAGLTVCIIKAMTLTEKQLDAIYENITEKSYYLPMRSTIVNKPAFCLIIGGKAGVAESVDVLKGKPTVAGTIRGDLSYINQMSPEQYQAFLEGRYTHHEQTGRPINDHIHMDDRFHSSEAGQDSRRAILSVFSGKDIARVAAEYPSFGEFMA